jgi:hypothetical protein
LIEKGFMRCLALQDILGAELKVESLLIKELAGKNPVVFNRLSKRLVSYPALPF